MNNFQKNTVNRALKVLYTETEGVLVLIYDLNLFIILYFRTFT